jgi:chromosome segregation ATPase
LNAEQSYRDIVGEEDCAGMKSAEKLSEENEKLTTDAEKFLNMISNCENDIRQKERELQQLQSAPNLELLEIKEKIKTLEEETEKNLEIEKEIEEIEQSNKNLQQSVERYQTAIKDFDAKQIQIQNENDQYQKELKNLTIQCNAIDKEIQRLETSTQEKINLVPTPPLKHRRSVSQPEKRKRKVLDIESDSSVDGERLSYAEFMAKKKMLKENKKQKR